MSSRSRPVGRGDYDDLQLFFAERRRAISKPLRAYHKLVPTFVARYCGITSQETAADAAQARERWVTWIFLGPIPVGLGLAAFGYCVLAYIATGKA